VVDCDVTGNDVVVSDRKWRHREATSQEMTSPEVTSPEVTGNDFIGSDVSVRDIIVRAFFLTGFLPRFFSSETPRGLLGNFWEFPIRILPAEISTNENLGNSTNEMP